jgi:hypothetical protein
LVNRWEEPEDQQGGEQGVRPGVGEAQPGDAGAVGGHDGVGDGGEHLVTSGRVVAESLDAEQAPIGGEADPPQGGQVGQPLRIPKS